MYRVHDNVTRFFRFVCTSMNNKWIKKTNKSFETIVYYLLFIYIYTCLFWIKKKITLQSKQENKETKKAKENERKRIPIKRGILTIFWKDTCPFAISQESFLTLTTDTTLHGTNTRFWLGTCGCARRSTRIEHLVWSTLLAKWTFKNAKSSRYLFITIYPPTLIIIDHLFHE